MPTLEFYTLQKIAWDLFPIAAAEAELAELMARVNEVNTAHRRAATRAHDAGAKFTKVDGVLVEVPDENVEAARAEANKLHSRIELLQYTLNAAKRHGQRNETETRPEGNGARRGRIGKLFQRGAKT